MQEGKRKNLSHFYILTIEKAAANIGIIFEFKILLPYYLFEYMSSSV